MINTLTQRNAVIVSDIAGTTRDAIDINLDISGYPVVITDTAGIRETDNPIEKQGIEIALQKISDADIVLALYDGNGVFKDENILPLDKTIFVANKMDSLSASQIQTVKDKRHLLISAKYNQGIDELIAVLLEKIKDNFSSSNFLITRIRYRKILKMFGKSCRIFIG